MLETAVALILTPGASGLDVLLIRRAERVGDPWSGQMGLPGGRRERLDDHLLDTALRETQEETGVLLNSDVLLGALDDMNPATPTLPKIRIRPFVFGVDARPLASSSPEVAATHWIALDSLAKSESRTTVAINGQMIEVPCFRGDALPNGVVVWGLTYRILRALMAYLNEAPRSTS